jgi:small subunit ribosomal protein S1
MEPRSLDGMAAFIRRVCAQIAESAPEGPQEGEATPPGATSTPEAVPEPRPSPIAQAQLSAAPQHQGGEPDSEPAPLREAEAGTEADWSLAEEALETGSVQESTVVGWNRGGLLVHWHSLQGFLPASQLQKMVRYTTDAERDVAFARRVGEALKLKVIEVDPGRKRLVFSERALQWGPGNGMCLWEDLEPGQVRRGRVRNLCDFGAFVDLGGVDGLIHISELSWRHVRHPSDTLEIGQDIDVYVMSVEPERKRVALSLKKLSQDPWEDMEERYQVGQIVQGVVTNVLTFGAFARIEDGIEGLIHISELAEGGTLHPRNVVAEGDRVTVRIISIDAPNRRLALSVRQAGDGPPSEGSATASV